MRELLGKKNHESDSEGGNKDASNISKSYNKASFDYGGSSKNPTLPMINPRKPPPFDGIRYIGWAHRMKLHLIAARCREVVDIGVNPLHDPNEWTPEDERDFHLNATAATLILQCLTSEDNNKVNGMVNAK